MTDNKLQELIDFARMEPESDDDLIQIMKELSVDDIRKAVDLGARLISAGLNTLHGIGKR